MIFCYFTLSKTCYVKVKALSTRENDTAVAFFFLHVFDLHLQTAIAPKR